MSTFASHHVQLLSSSVSVSNLNLDEGTRQVQSLDDDHAPHDSDELNKLYGLLAELKSPLDFASLDKTLQVLTEYEQKNAHTTLVTSEGSGEATSVKNVLTARILIGLYAQALDITLKEACEADAEAEWWADIERSTSTVVWYLFASEFCGLLRVVVLLEN